MNRDTVRIWIGSKKRATNTDAADDDLVNEKMKENRKKKINEMEKNSNKYECMVGIVVH